MERIQEVEEVMLARFGGRRGLLVTVIGVFLETYPETLAWIREAIFRRDAIGLEDAAHKLKGAVGNLMKGRAFELARDLEHMGREGRWDDVDETHAALEKEMERLDRTLRIVARA